MLASVVGSVVGSTVGGTVQVLLENGLSAIQDINNGYINIGLSCDSKLAQLSRTLSMVQSHLSDAEAFQVRGEAVKEWLKQLEDAAFDADAVLDEVKYHVLRCKVEDDNQDSNEVIELISSATREQFFKIQMSPKIEDVIKNLERINKDANDLGLPTAFAIASQMNNMRLDKPIGRETDSLSVEPFVVARDTDVSEIVEMLLTSPTEETISVLPIVGMGGVGKTTLARKVFHDEKIGNHFAERIWVCVSFDFDSLLLFKKILGVPTQVEATGTREAVLQNIRKRFANKRYLLVLDDVWNENNMSWGEFMNTLTNISGVKGNCIVVTTRKENVASQARTLPSHHLGGLTESQCWSIIKAEAFPRMDVPEEFESIGKEIAKKCSGLPLAAKVVGGLLRGKSEEHWCNILKNKLSDGNDINKILLLSYDNLPSIALKKCFAYCSVFPQDYSIRKQELIEFWMAEGFLHDGKGDNMESVGNENFNHLLQCSLLQDAEADSLGDIVSCKMHDIVHELACSVTKSMHQIRYLAFKSADTNELNAIISQGQEKYLRTMFYDGKIANDIFSNFSCLHVLKLESQDIQELPYEIEKLIHLRCLDISSRAARHTRLPDSIGKLYHLQTLSIGEDGKLPNTITNLLSLRHLHFSGTELPPWIGKLTSLRTLETYVVRDGNGYSIRELGSLKNLKGQLAIHGLEFVMDKKEAELADLYGKPKNFKLSLYWDKSSDDKRNHENVLDGLQPYPRLKYLHIDGYGSKSLPQWTMKMAARNKFGGQWEAFNSMVEIELSNFTECEELPMLGHLRRLRILTLKKFHRVRFIGHDNRGNPNSSFPALETLEMLKMPELTKWGDVNGATIFPCLKYLTIKRCPKLKNVYCHFPCLKVFEVNDAGFPLTNIDCSLTDLFSNTISLRDISIGSLSGLDYFPDDFFVKNQNLTKLVIIQCDNLMRLVPISLGGGASLKELIIYGCRNLKELPDDLNTLCNLESLTIIDCPGLKSIPYGQSQGLTSLRRLHISDCKGLTVIPIELLESSLETLWLEDLENLENMDSLIPCLERMPRLWNLIIANVPKFTLPMEIGCLKSLQNLRIGGFSEPMNVDQIITIVSKCPSLKYLGLVCTKQHYDSLHNIIQQRFQHIKIDNHYWWTRSPYYYNYILICKATLSYNRSHFSAISLQDNDPDHDEGGEDCTFK